MIRMWRTWLALMALVAAVLLVLAPRAPAGPTQDYDTGDAVRNGTTAYRSALGVADSTSVTAPLAGLTPRATGGRQTIAVRATFDTTGATVAVRVLRWTSRDGSTFTLLSRSDAVTITASTDGGAGDVREGPTVVFDAEGATHWEVRVAAPSAGNVDLRTWAY